MCDIVVDMYVAKVPNRGSPPAILLRESYREDGKVKNRTLSNLSHWPEEKVEALSAVLKGIAPRHSIEDSFSIVRSLPHGHVAAVLGMVKSLGLDELIDAVPSRFQRLVVAMVVSQVIDPNSKLSISRAIRADTASSSLGEVLGLESVDVNELYQTMDGLLLRQKDIEDALALRHLEGATLVLYDSFTAAFEGRTCPLGMMGHPKDGVRGRLQIVYGLLASVDGVPIAIEVFAGNTADPKTISAQIEKIKQRYGNVTHGLGALAGCQLALHRCWAQARLVGFGWTWLALRYHLRSSLLGCAPWTGVRERYRHERAHDHRRGRRRTPHR